MGRTLYPIVITAPPCTTLVTGLPLSALSSNSQGYCGTSLLQDPLTRARAQSLAQALESSTLPLSMLMPVSVNFNTTMAIIEGEWPRAEAPADAGPAPPLAPRSRLVQAALAAPRLSCSPASPPPSASRRYRRASRQPGGLPSVCAIRHNRFQRAAAHAHLPAVLAPAHRGRACSPAGSALEAGGAEARGR